MTALGIEANLVRALTVRCDQSSRLIRPQHAQVVRRRKSEDHCASAYRPPSGNAGVLRR